MARHNIGIRPLPNLETRFVAANTLLALRNLQGTLTSERIIEDAKRTAPQPRAVLSTPTAAHKSVNTRTTTADFVKTWADELVKVGLASDRCRQNRQMGPLRPERQRRLVRRRVHVWRV